MLKNFYHCVVAFLAVCLPCFIDTHQHRQKAQASKMKRTQRRQAKRIKHFDDYPSKPRAVSAPEDVSQNPFFDALVASAAYEEIGQYERDKVEEWKHANRPPATRPIKLQHIPRDGPKDEQSVKFIREIARRNMDIIEQQQLAKNPPADGLEDDVDEKSRYSSAREAHSRHSDAAGEARSLHQVHTNAMSEDRRTDEGSTYDRDEITNDEYDEKCETASSDAHKPTIIQDGLEDEQRPSQTPNPQMQRGYSKSSSQPSSEVPELVHVMQASGRTSNRSSDSSEDYPFNAEDVDDVGIQLVETAEGILLPAIPSVTASNRSSMHEAILSVGQTLYKQPTPEITSPTSLKRYYRASTLAEEDDLHERRSGVLGT